MRQSPQNRYWNIRIIFQHLTNVSRVNTSAMSRAFTEAHLQKMGESGSLRIAALCFLTKSVTCASSSSLNCYEPLQAALRSRIGRSWRTAFKKEQCIIRFLSAPDVPRMHDRAKPYVVDKIPTVMIVIGVNHNVVFTPEPGSAPGTLERRYPESVARNQSRVNRIPLNGRHSAGQSHR